MTVSAHVFDEVQRDLIQRLGDGHGLLERRLGLGQVGDLVVVVVVVVVVIVVVAVSL